jgi:hypothetical protein
MKVPGKITGRSPEDRRKIAEPSPAMTSTTPPEPSRSDATILFAAEARRAGQARLQTFF